MSPSWVYCHPKGWRMEILFSPPPLFHYPLPSFFLLPFHLAWPCASPFTKTKALTHRNRDHWTLGAVPLSGRWAWWWREGVAPGQASRAAFRMLFYPLTEEGFQLICCLSSFFARACVCQRCSQNGTLIMEPNIPDVTWLGQCTIVRLMSFFQINSNPSGFLFTDSNWIPFLVFTNRAIFILILQFWFLHIFWMLLFPPLHSKTCFSFSLFPLSELEALSFHRLAHHFSCNYCIGGYHHNCKYFHNIRGRNHLLFTFHHLWFSS